MHNPSFDLTAGERARAIASDPDALQPIYDPTDPRCAPRRARASRLHRARRRPDTRPVLAAKQSEDGP